MKDTRPCGHHSTVRWRDEPELQCERCKEFWPITLEFWDPHYGFKRCKGCLREMARARQRQRRTDPAAVERDHQYKRESVPAKRRAMRSDPVEGDKVRAYHRDWMRRDRERKRAEQAA